MTRRDLAVRVHESLVSNLSRALLGGVRLTDEQLAEILLERTGEVPAGLEIMPDKSKWAITFSPVDPVSAVFADNTIRFAVRGRRFELDATVVRNTLEMSAVYAFEQTATGARSCARATFPSTISTCAANCARSGRRAHHDAREIRGPVRARIQYDRNEARR